MDYQQVKNDILDKAAMFRGIFINQVTHIEKLIDYEIAKHFCGNDEKGFEMVDLILGDKFISFESKRAIFESVTKKHHPANHKANKANFERLTKIQTHRNKLAHLICAVDKQSINKFMADGTLGFVRFKSKTEPFYYSPKEQNEALMDLTEILNWLLV